MPIEESVRAMFTAGARLTSEIPAARISHGYRLQDGILPALTYELSNVERQSIAGGQTVWLATVDANIIAATTKAALDILPFLIEACTSGTYSGVAFNAVIWRGHVTAQASVGEGDEAEPAEVTATIDIYYRE